MGKVKRPKQDRQKILVRFTRFAIFVNLLIMIYVAIEVVPCIKHLSGLHPQVHFSSEKIYTTVEIHVEKPYLRGMEINDYFEALMVHDEAYLLEILQQITPNYVYAYAGVIFAIVWKVPVPYVFSEIDVETDRTWDEKLVHENENGTFDYGLMGLNSRYYGHVPKSLLFNPSWNISAGCQHLRGLYEVHGDWKRSIYRYNGDGTPATWHLVRISNRAEEYEALINQFL